MNFGGNERMCDVWKTQCAESPSAVSTQNSLIIHIQASHGRQFVPNHIGGSTNYRVDIDSDDFHALIGYDGESMKTKTKK